MSGFVIYSMGDPSFMRLALLGLSHAFEQGAISIAKIGLMLGLLAVFWNGIWNPGKIEFKQFFIGFFLVLILFGKSVPVTLIHADGGADAMPDIPVGIALGGTLATTFGYTMANSLREFYHTTYVPGSAATGSYRAMIGIDGDDPSSVPVAGNGLEPLRELMKMRFTGDIDEFKAGQAYAATAAITSGASATDLASSVDSYIKNCVLKDLYLKNGAQEINENAMSTLPYSWDAMKVTYNGWTTEVNVDAGQGWKVMGCSDAYVKIGNAIGTEWKYVAEHGGSIGGNADEIQLKEGQSMLTDTSYDAWKIKVNQILQYHWKKAKAGSPWASEAELMASQAEFQAIDQRRVSTAVQYSLWSEMAIPLITYIEAFVFLIGPIMPFVVAFGEKGMGMVIKYFFLLIWVNTWPILQVGVNMYLQNAMNNASFNSTSYDAFSWAGYNTSFTELESFIAMGATLQTMVPALSLMLLYGSVHTAINLSNSASKGGGSEGAVATPKATGSADGGKLSVGQNSKVYDASAGGSVDSYTGSNSAPIGMAQNNTKTDLNNTTSAALTNATETAKQESSKLNNAHQEMFNNMTVGGENATAAQTEAATKNEGIARANAYAKTLMDTGQFTAQDAKTLGLALSGGMGVKAQAEAAAALGFGKDGAVSAKFGAAVKGEMGVDAKSKLDAAISNVASKTTQSGDNWNFSNTESGSAMLSKAESLSTSRSSGENAGFGESGSRAVEASTAWTNAQKQVEQESKVQAAIAGMSSGISYNLAGVTSTAANNKNDEKFADGSLLAGVAQKTALGSMNAEQRQKFDDFKKQGGYEAGLNGDMKALKDFAGTKDGESLKGMAGQFKTTDQYAAEYDQAIKQDTGNDKSLQARMAATGRYADKAFKDIMLNSGSQRYQAGANYLDTLNDNIGGGMKQWSAAANDIRNIGAAAEAPLKNGPPPTAEQDGGPTKKSVEATNERGKAAAVAAVAAQQAAIATTNPSQTHQENKVEIADNVKADPTKEAKADEVLKNADKQTGAAQKDVPGIVQPLTDGIVPTAKALEPLAQSAADTGKWLNNTINGTKQEQATERLAASEGVSKDIAAKITGQDSNTQHSDLVQAVSNGLRLDATQQERNEALGTLAAAKGAESEIARLRATGDKEDAALADTMQRNVNSVNTALDRVSGIDKDVLSGLAEKVNSGELSMSQANAGLQMAMNDKYDPVKAAETSFNTNTGGMQGNNMYGHKVQEAAFNRLENDIAGGKAIMSEMESKGQVATVDYQLLSSRVEQAEQFMESKKDEHTASVATSAFKDGIKGSDGFNELSKVGNQVISDALKGNDVTALNKANIDTAMSGSESKGFSLFSAGETKSVEQMKQYEEMRGGLVNAAEALKATPGMEAAGARLDSAIQKLDAQTGFDARNATQGQATDTKPSSNGDNAPAGNGNQGTTTPANDGNVAQGQGGDTKPSSSGDNAPAGNGNQGTTTPANGGNVAQGQVGNSSVPIESKTVAGTNGAPDRIDVTPGGFKDMMQAENGSKLEIGGEEFTKVSSGTNFGMESVKLENTQTGESHYLYNSESKGSNLSIEK
ncbi:conjugal transfer protein TraG N-terminal domain-containing protein [Vibrio cholerae]|nr:conjugal transfer protein TraG N-terminal domain-containing protein [Vibrio cholerae]MDF4284608.1 conjugal transfer protein TraG N-terminal domain-containing protein [Vibrio parahaemolyticus]EJL6644107.1 conjugal transfer protein TraG N-terminal domain-containing protein [Vibrio cholerae]MDF4499864.1 conjugal transfer protein TraG N-terminal domain-containing protein [Vibrio parahaemolyticus]MDG3379950.1 conjugal transfer protein TraG N-terminal domain-containing protein [Vibrio parahaemolyt